MDTNPQSHPQHLHSPPGGEPAEDAGLYEGLDDPTNVQPPTPAQQPAPPRPAQQSYVQPPYAGRQPYPPQPPYPARSVYPPAYYEPPPAEEDDDDGGSGQEAKLWILRVAKGVVFFLYVVVTAALVLLAIAFVLQLFGANPDASFANWIYDHTERVMSPFRGLFEQHTINDKSVVDFSLLFAMIIYAMVAIGLHALVTWLADHVVQANKNIAWHERQEALRRREAEERRLRAQQGVAGPPPQARPPTY